MVARIRVASDSHSRGRRTNSSVGMRYVWIWAENIMIWKPIRPMSWVSGIHERLRSVLFSPAAVMVPWQLAMMLP